MGSGASAFPAVDGLGKAYSQTATDKSVTTPVRFAGRGGRVGFGRGIGFRGRGIGFGRGFGFRGRRIGFGRGIGWRRGWGYGWGGPVGLGLGYGAMGVGYGGLRRRLLRLRLLRRRALIGILRRRWLGRRISWV